MFVDADAGAGSILTVDVCSSSSTTFQQFEYSLATSATGCESGNENGFAVQIKPAAVVDIGGDLCFSASSSAGVTVTLQTCNSADESQLFFINVPSITTQPWEAECSSIESRLLDDWLNREKSDFLRWLDCFWVGLSPQCVHQLIQRF